MSVHPVHNSVFRDDGDDLEAVRRRIQEDVGRFQFTNLTMKLDSGNEVFVTTEELVTGKYSMFGIQTKHQRELWHMANDIVIVDSTACVSRYRHVLWSVVSVGKDNRGHVLAWLVVQGESKDAIVPLLRELHSRCGDTHPRLFISDDAPALYNSWLVAAENIVERT